MNHAADLPVWVAVIVAAFLVVGSGLTLVGSYGFFRLHNFYVRTHAPTLGTSWGTGAILLASILFFSVLGSRPVAHELLIGVFVTVTTPVTLMLLGRAALYRDRAERNGDVPPLDAPLNVLTPSVSGEPEDDEAPVKARS